MSVTASSASKRAMSRVWLWTPALLLALSASSYVLYRVLQPELLPDGFVYGNGHIEGTEVRIASEVGGRVLEQHLVEGAPVAANDPLVIVDAQGARDQLNALQSEADAMQRTATAIDAQIATWTHHAQTARDQVARVHKLVVAGLASAQARDSARDAAQQADGELQRLRAQRQALDAQSAAAAARVEQAQTQLSYTTVVAPQDGVILVRAVEVGEVIQPGQPLALLVDLQRLELKVYLPSTDAGRVQLDQAARVRVDAFPERFFEARVARIDAYAQFTPRDIHVPAERTQMVYGVTLALVNDGQQLKPGMPADAWIRWDDRLDWPAALPVPRG